MNYEDLIGSLLAEIRTIFLAIIIINVLYIPIYKRCINGFLDPLLIVVVFASLANSVPFYLYFAGLMRTELFLFILLFEGCFWLFFYKIHIRFKYEINEKTRKNENLLVEKVGLLSIFIVILLQLYIYRLNGIPLFNESRFTATGGNDTIVNLLQRIIGPFNVFLSLYCFYKIDSRKKKGYFILLVILGFSFLSGAKSFILRLISAYFYYNIFYKRKIPHVKWYFILFIALTPLFILFSKSDYALNAYLYRLIGNGDIYWNAVYDDAIDHIKIENPIINQTHLLWGPFRHLIGFTPGPSDIAIAGESIMEYAYSYISGVPNSRLPVLGWIYFRWWGLLFAMFMGWLVAFLIKKVPNMFNNSLISTFYKASFYSIGASFITDGYLGFSNLLGVIFFSMTVACIRLLTQKKQYGHVVNYNN